jgi:hypothetical protein
VAATALVGLVGGAFARERAARGAAAPGPARLILAACATGFMLLAAQAWAALGAPWAGVSWRSYPRGLAEAAAREAPGAALYAPFDWAGYLAWRFDSERRVYAYGRLDVFHERLARAAAARAAPASWSAFLEGAGIGASFERAPRQLLRGVVTDVAKRRRLELPRSPFAIYYPPERWRLAHWSDEGFLFVRRGAGGGESWLDPSDAAYLALSAEQGWIARGRACRELDAHRSRFGPSRFDGALSAACGR